MTILNLESCPLCLTSHVVSRGYPIMYKVVCDCGTPMFVSVNGYKNRSDYFLKYYESFDFC